MAKFKVTIREKIEYVYVIDAETLDEAEDEAHDRLMNWDSTKERAEFKPDEIIEHGNTFCTFRCGTKEL